MKEVNTMEYERDDIISFETAEGETLEFTILHEFYHDGSKYAVLKPADGADAALIAEVVDPEGPEEEFVPLPMKRQQALLDYLNRGGAED
jgi:hypothetical protein